MSFAVIVNGTERQIAAGDGQSLLEVLREQLGLTGPKFGCGEGACGACTVLIGRRPVTACTTPAAEAAGQRVTTVEGLAEDGILHPAQQAWLEAGAMQCGYCTAGWLTATAALLARVPHPDDERIAAELAGNICRCCTYPRILRAVRRAADLMEHPEELVPVPPGPVPSLASADAGADVSADAGGAPWDRAGKDADAFFGVLPDGLVAVVDAADDAWVHVGADGTVTAFTGKVKAGQGTRTALALLVAEELALPAAAVRLVMGNTDISPFDLGTFGSRSMPYAAPPLRAAAAAAGRMLRDAAAERLGMSAADLTVADGIVAGPDGAPSISYGDLLGGPAAAGAGAGRRAGHAAARVALGRPSGQGTGRRGRRDRREALPRRHPRGRHAARRRAAGPGLRRGAAQRGHDRRQRAAGGHGGPRGRLHRGRRAGRQGGPAGGRPDRGGLGPLPAACRQ